MATPGTQRPPAWRVLVAGGGAPGLTLALALARPLAGAVGVAVADPGFARPRADGRAYAVSPGAVRLLTGLGVWDGLAARAQPIRAMTITDSRLDDTVRPDYLGFGHGEANALGHMIEAGILTGALAGACRASGVTLLPTGVTRFEAGPNGIDILREDGVADRAALLVAADGARSRLRQAARIAWIGRPYGQSGIVGTIRHERPHGGVAVQHFLPSGPFAILPLVDGEGAMPHRSSLVWAERREAAAALMALDPGSIEAELSRRIGPELGRAVLEGELRTFPLAQGRARTAFGARFALLGDAAHEIHPLAGQGLNLGLADAAALAERIADAVRLGLDPGDAPVLEGYDRDRRPATLAMLAATDGLNALFSNDVTPVRVLRDIGLGLVDRSTLLKRLFMAEAQGAGPRVPRLMRGETI